MTATRKKPPIERELKFAGVDLDQLRARLLELEASGVGPPSNEDNWLLDREGRARSPPAACCACASDGRGALHHVQGSGDLRGPDQGAPRARDPESRTRRARSRSSRRSATTWCGATRRSAKSGGWAPRPSVSTTRRSATSSSSRAPRPRRSPSAAASTSRPSVRKSYLMLYDDYIAEHPDAPRDMVFPDAQVGARAAPRDAGSAAARARPRRRPRRTPAAADGDASQAAAAGRRPAAPRLDARAPARRRLRGGGDQPAPSRRPDSRDVRRQLSRHAARLLRGARAPRHRRRAAAARRVLRAPPTACWWSTATASAAGRSRRCSPRTARRGAAATLLAASRGRSARLRRRRRARGRRASRRSAGARSRTPRRAATWSSPARRSSSRSF